MTATDVRDRARSLADLPNALVISHDDEINSLNESWHDVYEFLEQNDDDYYLTETVITLTSAMISPTNLAAGEWLIPMPTDLKSIRYLDYNSGTSRWLSINKAPLSSRNIGPAEPQYRIRGAYIWIMGGYLLGPGSQIRIGYYPTPETLTLPLPTLTFGTSYSPASFNNISDPFYTQTNQTMVYVYQSTTIYAESISNNTVGAPINLFSAPGAITQLQYYKGLLYLLYSNNIYSAAGTLTSTLTFVQVSTTSDVTDFSIYKDTIYYTTATAVKTCTLLGGTITPLQLALSAPYDPFTNGTNVYYVDSTGKLGMTGSTATIMSSITNAYCNPSSQRVFVVSNNFLYTASIASTSISTLATISSDVLSLHMPEPTITTPTSDLDQSYWPVITRESQNLLAIGGQAPWEFNYPNNLFTELISYQMAIDFRVKAGQDPAMLIGRLGSRDVATNMTGLWLRMYQSLRRDDYQPNRIQNRYSERHSGIW